jgi:hypothetical protein
MRRGASEVVPRLGYDNSQLSALCQRWRAVGDCLLYFGQAELRARLKTPARRPANTHLSVTESLGAAAAVIRKSHQAMQLLQRRALLAQHDHQCAAHRRPKGAVDAHYEQHGGARRPAIRFRRVGGLGKSRLQSAGRGESGCIVGVHGRHHPGPRCLPQGGLLVARNARGQIRSARCHRSRSSTCSYLASPESLTICFQASASRPQRQAYSELRRVPLTNQGAFARALHSY